MRKHIEDDLSESTDQRDPTMGRRKKIEGDLRQSQEDLSRRTDQRDRAAAGLKKFEFDLRQSQVEQARIADDLTTLIDTANAPIFGIDAEGNVNEWNQKAESITGFSKEDVMGHELVSEFITDDYKDAVKKVLDEALQGKETSNYEFRLYTKTGNWVDVLLNSTTRRDAAGKVIGVVGVGQNITELNQARVEQARIADDLTTLIDTANAPIFGIDAEGNVNEWNQTAESITGFSKEDVMGHDLVSEFITDDYKHSVKKILDEALQGKQTSNYEFPLYTKTGHRVDVLLNSTTRRDAAGKVIGVVGVGQNITELNQARVEQARIADDLTTLIDTANAPIFGIDAEGNVNEWNQKAESITGFSKEDVMGHELVSEFITDDYKDAVKKVLDEALQGKQTSNYEFPLYTKTGHRVDVLLNSTTRRDAAGKVIGVVGVGQNITELNQARVEQARIADDLTTLIDTANAPIFGIDAEGNVNEWNQTAESITGFSKEDVMGHDLVSEFITDDYKHSVKKILDEALQGKQTSNYEFPLYTKTGHRVDVLLNSTTRRDAAGKVIGVVGVGQNITELKNVQAQVIQASKLASLGEMATSVAHELNQPLNTIRMAASNIDDMIELNKLTSGYLTNKLQRIDEQIERASGIVNHMRMFGRKANEKPVRLDPRNVIKGALNLLGERLRLANIEVIDGCDYESPFILGHQIQLEQVFINILNNARDSILENGGNTKSKITIERIPVDDDQLKIVFTDTGGGIPVKLLPFIFNPFVTSKEMGKGTGLGLSVSYGIIRDMNGTISAENVEDGARIIITFPTAA